MIGVTVIHPATPSNTNDNDNIYNNDNGIPFILWFVRIMHPGTYGNGDQNGNANSYCNENANGDDDKANDNDGVNIIFLMNYGTLISIILGPVGG